MKRGVLKISQQRKKERNSLKISRQNRTQQEKRVKDKTIEKAITPNK